MTDSRFERAQVLAEIRAVILDAFREYRLLETPGCIHELAPPNASDAEERIVSALLCGHATLATIAPLRARDFFVPLHRAVVTAVDELGESHSTLTPELIASAIEAKGFRGDLVAAILEVRDGVPFVIDLSDCIARVRDAARRRRLIAWLRKLQTELAFDGLSVDEAIARIRAAGGKSE